MVKLLSFAGFWFSCIAIGYRVSKGLEDGHRLPALWAGYP
jgi:hypothetical protein